MHTIKIIYSNVVVNLINDLIFYNLKINIYIFSSLIILTKIRIKNNFYIKQYIV